MSALCELELLVELLDELLLSLSLSPSNKSTSSFFDEEAELFVLLDFDDELDELVELLFFDLELLLFVDELEELDELLELLDEEFDVSKSSSDSLSGKFLNNCVSSSFLIFFTEFKSA